MRSFGSGARAAALVSQMATMTIVGALLGRWLDSRFSTGNALLLVGLFGGFTLGMVSLFGTLARLEGDDDDRPPDPPQ